MLECLLRRQDSVVPNISEVRMKEITAIACWTAGTCGGSVGKLHELSLFNLRQERLKGLRLLPLTLRVQRPLVARSVDMVGSAPGKAL